ncbi:MAG: nickel pincer cofactor biosynthesis protein LarC [Actinomycetota bacterium]|nr:nickel pincer cofactor biosynthesis protein LarC [Actinomycetota bacterium]
MQILYFDCIAGISGDMALGALIDAGADFEAVKHGLASLPIDAFTIDVEETETQGLRATRVVVETAAAGVIRTYASIRALLEAADLPEEAHRLAQRVFRRLAEAEAMVHRKEVESVTFHEVGAVDSIVDITGTALALSTLGIERAFSSPVPTGMGMTRSEHGAMPIPAPAVVELLRGAPLYSKGVNAELVTPTGAAILSALVEGYGELPPMRVGAVGYGAGSQQLDFPNVLRVIIGDDVDVPKPALVSLDLAETGEAVEAATDEIILETNVDDLEPELYEYVIERLLAAGAQDAWLTPIVMKKSRPAVTVSVLCAREQAQEMRRILFRETGTLGVRTVPVSKTALAREMLKVETAFGPVAVKIGIHEGRVVTLSPEFEDCARLAREFGVPAREVHQEAVRRAREEIDRRS